MRRTKVKNTLITAVFWILFPIALPFIILPLLWWMAADILYSFHWTDTPPPFQKQANWILCKLQGKKTCP